MTSLYVLVSILARSDERAQRVSVLHAELVSEVSILARSDERAQPGAPPAPNAFA